MVELTFYVNNEQAIVFSDPEEFLKESVQRALNKLRITDLSAEKCTCICNQGRYDRIFLDLNAKINDQWVSDQNGRKTNEHFHISNQAINIIPTSHKSRLIDLVNPYRNM